MFSRRLGRGSVEVYTIYVFVPSAIIWHLTTPLSAHIRFVLPLTCTPTVVISLRLDEIARVVCYWAFVTFLVSSLFSILSSCCACLHSVVLARGGFRSPFLSSIVKVVFVYPRALRHCNRRSIVLVHPLRRSNETFATTAGKK